MGFSRSGVSHASLYLPSLGQVQPGSGILISTCGTPKLAAGPAGPACRSRCGSCPT